MSQNPVRDCDTQAEGRLASPDIEEGCLPWMLLLGVWSFDCHRSVRARISTLRVMHFCVRPLISCGVFTDSLTSPVRTIQFYRTASGKSPVEEFLDSLSDRHAQKVAWVLRLVEQLDIVPEQYLKKLVGTKDLWEVRVQIGGNSYRFLGFFDGSQLLILTHGYSKKQQKTPRREIDLAHQRRTEYYQRRK